MIANLAPPGRDPAWAQAGTWVPDACEKALLAGLELEIKANQAGKSTIEVFETLLDDLLKELRAQTDSFRQMRQMAQTLIDNPGMTDDGVVKQAKSDIKMATEAISVVARTLEKIDALRRATIEDRLRADEQNFDEETYEKILADIETAIRARLEDKPVDGTDLQTFVPLADVPIVAREPGG